MSATGQKPPFRPRGGHVRSTSLTGNAAGLPAFSFCRSVERGMFLGVLNKRGPTWRRPTDGGIQERDLAQSYRNLSKFLRLEWPRTSALLERVAKSLEH